MPERHWTTYNYAALWMGMAHNIPSYLLAAGLVALGMNWLQAFLTITLGNLIVLVPLLLNSHAGTKYGIPFPVFARAFYGVRGANFPALLRAFIACGWFGIQTWIGGQAIYVIVGELAGSGWTEASAIGGHPWTMWLSFAFFWVAADGADLARHRRAAPVRELGRAAGHGRVPRADDRDPGEGRRLRADPVAAVQARLGRRLLDDLRAVADGHDRVLGDAVAEHAGLHPVRRRASASR